MGQERLSLLRTPSDEDMFDLEVGEADFEDDGLTLYNAVSVRHETARLVDYDAGDAIYARGERVVCETEEGVQVRCVALASRRLLAKGKLLRVLRRTDEGDVANDAKTRAREQFVYRQAKEAAQRLRLPIKVVRAESTRGGQGIVIFFASEEKVAYRNLLRALSQTVPERIELRQIGSRDAAKVIGGVGPCGLQLCCNTFLSDFAPVSIKMAKNQGLALNPQRVSGVCGRLLCCLVYEEAYYRAARRLVPRIGEKIWTARGFGRVKDVDVLRMQVRTVLEDGDIYTCEASEIDPTRRENTDAVDD